MTIDDWVRGFDVVPDFDPVKNPLGVPEKKTQPEPAKVPESLPTPVPA